ncbi:MAG: cytochrome c peroxidase [Acidobacteriota bacterium]|nr:cytochrome c peroxidase [Acidobacteriota bacterium]
MQYSLNTLKLAAAFALVLCGAFAHVRSAQSGAERGDAPSRQRPVTFVPVLPKGIPPGVWRRSIPPDNPLTAEKVALGESLFFEKRLSVDGTVSCATCHDPAMAFSDGNMLAVGVERKVGTRNVPTVLNAMFSRSLFWDGRARTLEEQAKQPLVNPLEMGMPDQAAVVARLGAVPEYRRQFRQVFGAEGLTADNVAKAIAAYERTQLSAGSPFDRFIGGDGGALSEAQQRGWKLFQTKAQCIKCHTFSPSAPFFSDFGFHNTGVATRGRVFEQLAGEAVRVVRAEPDRTRALSRLAHTEGFTELGRFLITGRAAEIGAFKTPSLRDIELTAPYMHNASEKTLLDVVRFYNLGGEKNSYLDKNVRSLNLTDAEMSDLVEFMRALTSDDVMRRTQSSRPQTRLSALR